MKKLLCLLLMLVLAGCSSKEPAVTTPTHPSIPQTQQTETEAILAGAYTGSDKFLIDECVFYRAENSIECYFDGESKTIYNGSLKAGTPVCTNGKVAYVMREDSCILRVDVQSGEITELFTPNADSVTLIGASASEIFLGVQQGEDAFGVTVESFDFEGNLRWMYAENVNARMTDGILVMTGYRGDVSATSLYAVDVTTQTVLADSGEDYRVWGTYVQDHTLYRLQVPCDYYEKPHEMQLIRNQNEQLASYRIDYAAYGVGVLDGLGIIAEWDCDQSTVLNIITGEVIMENEDFDHLYVDTNGEPYLLETGTVYRLDGKKVTTFEPNSTLLLLNNDHLYTYKDGKIIRN